MPLATKLRTLPAWLHAAACTNALQLQYGLQCLQLKVRAKPDARLLRRIAAVLPDVAALQALALSPGFGFCSFSSADRGRMLRAAAQLVLAAQQHDSRIVIAHLGLPPCTQARAEYQALVDICAPILLSISPPIRVILEHVRRDISFPLLKSAEPLYVRDLWQASRYCPSLADMTLTVTNETRGQFRGDLRAVCAHLASWSVLRCLRINCSGWPDDIKAMLGVMRGVAQLTALTRLQLTLTSSTLREAMSQLSKLTQLQDCSITECAEVTARPEARLQDIAHLTRLTNLDVYMRVDAAEVANLSAALHSLRRLESLRLDLRWRADAPADAAPLWRAIAACDTLQVLSVTALGTSTATLSLNALTALKTLDLQGTWPTRRFAQDAVSSLGAAANLRAVMLCGGCIQCAADVAALMAALCSHRHLTYLDLLRNSIGAAGVDVVANAFAGMPQLTHFRWAYNRLSQRSAQVLATGATQLTSLRMLDLNGCFDPYSEGYKQLHDLRKVLPVEWMSVAIHPCIPDDREFWNDSPPSLAALMGVPDTYTGNKETVTGCLALAALVVGVAVLCVAGIRLSRGASR